ncbi:TPA: type II toxin-antitoxin system RelE/ParE family toxin [Streptococcus suis]|nr:type II toxin-antitoxin system RelE/ParE family toxin [Streptococcus suis]
MEFESYSVILAPTVEKELAAIYAYFSEQFSEEIAKKRIGMIVEALESLRIFPERGFNADNRFGKQIDPPHLTRGYLIGKDYIALYRVVENEVRVGHFFATKSDYVKLLK